MKSLDISGAEFALFVLTEYEAAIEEAMDHLASPPTENALIHVRAALGKAIVLAREARLKKARRA